MRSTSLSSVACPLSSKVLAFALVLSFVFTSAQAEEWGFSYTGRLLEVKDGKRSPAKMGGSTDFVTNFYVRLYDDAEKTSVKSEALWGRFVERVPVKDGNFAFEISDAVGTPLAGVPHERILDAFSALTGDRMTVGITPFDDAHDEITPRQQLVSVPYAVFAGDARGARDGLVIEGTLTAAGLASDAVTFRDSVTHAGEAAFTKAPSIANLTLADGVQFQTREIRTEGTFKARQVSVENLAMREAEVDLKDAASLVAAGDLTVKGAVSASVMTAQDGEQVTLENDVGAHALSAATVVLNGGVDLFNFDDDVAVIKQGTEGSTMAWAKNRWTVPTREQQEGNGHNYFVSLSLQVPTNETVTVQVDSKTVAQLRASGVSTPVWLPFQTLLKPGEMISWALGDDRQWGDTNVLLTVRAAGF